jgi:hypothetical protein
MPLPERIEGTIPDVGWATAGFIPTSRNLKGTLALTPFTTLK